MDSKFIKSHPCSLERSDRSISHKKLQNQNNEDFSIQLLYTLLNLTNNNFPLCSLYL